MKNKKNFRQPAIGLFLLLAFPSWADELSQQIRQCSSIGDNVARLACFDHLNLPASKTSLQLENKPANEAARTDSLQLTQEAAVQDSTGTTGTEKPTTSVLSRHWELDEADKRGIFNFRPHHDNYFIVTYNPSPNETPYRPFRPLAPNAGDLSHSELAFQLGFKVKLLQEPMGMPMDLWFGYTQRSFWQAQNQEASSPFRESDYQPELMAVIPLNVDLPAMKMRFLNFGLAHQSNGQASSLSRSWNRIYAQLGFEGKDFTLLTRIWKRIREDRDMDDNPNIVDYMGRGDVLGTYRWNRNELALLGRYNFSTGKGAAQINWAFPIVSNLKGYLQYFSGYGYSLIDYNAYQSVLELGVLIEFK